MRKRYRSIIVFLILILSSVTMLFTLVQYFSLENELQSYTYITLVVVTHERHIAERAEKIIHLLDGTVQQVEELKTFSKI